MALWSQMFPSQFEREYNLPREYVYTPVVTRPKPEIRDPLRRKQQDIADEQGIMRSAQFKHRQYHSLTVPEITGRRPYANLTQSIRGGDLLTEEGQRLGREILKKRAENYREINANQPYTALPVETPAFTPFNIIDTDLSNAIASISYGAVPSKAVELIQKVLSELLAKGNELSSDELQILQEKLGDATDLNILRNLDEERRIEEEQPDVTLAYKLFLRYFDVLIRTLLFLIKYSENSPRERAFQQKALRKEVSAYIRKSELASAEPLRRDARMDTRIRPTPRESRDAFQEDELQLYGDTPPRMIGEIAGEGRLRRRLR